MYVQKEATVDEGAGCDLALVRQVDVVVGSRDGRGELVEDDGLGGDGSVLLQAVVFVVHSHTHHLVWASDRRQELDIRVREHTLATGHRSKCRDIFIYIYIYMELVSHG